METATNSCKFSTRDSSCGSVLSCNSASSPDCSSTASKIVEGLVSASTSTFKARISETKLDSDAVARPPSSELFATTFNACQNESPRELAILSILSIARSPIPRFGTLIIRRSETSSSKLTSTFK